MSPRDEHDPILNLPAGLVFALGAPGGPGSRRREPAKVEPSADQREAARTLHGMYQAFIDENFTPNQAIELIKAAISRGQAQ